MLLKLLIINNKHNLKQAFYLILNFRDLIWSVRSQYNIDQVLLTDGTLVIGRCDFTKIMLTTREGKKWYDLMNCEMKFNEMIWLNDMI